ncbi:sensor histidine kinase [Pseudonocardia humida]|uniref:histidine kinase n=1 Tax=Pseudonocardia humida TaxID=2800819 RepID=A0ABT0ZUJ0_9PSEU|nr:HAMP domain-containing sensor histidine kinase [Pseudonocardia humida]MCO1654397.1 HAMP domain-containing protein [Pseudonocardia humida]
MRAPSVRARLLMITSGLLVVGLAASIAGALVDLRRPLVERIDEELRISATVAAAVEPLARQYADSRATRPPDARVGEREGRYVALFDPEGRLEAVPQPPAERTGPQLPPMDAAASAGRGGEPFEVPGEAGSASWRVLGVPRADGAGSVVVGASLAEVDRAIDGIVGRFLGVAAGVLVLLVTAGWFAVGAGLRPLRRVEETATAIAGGDLARRVPELAGPGTEVGRLAGALNGMLAQIEAAFAARAASEARMRRFVADASHELRTPLFTIRGSTELYRMGGLSAPADVDRTMTRIEDESSRLVALVEDLLLLARLDERAADGPPVVDPAPMDLRTLAADALHDLRALDPTREVRLTGPGDGPVAAAPLLGDEARLRQVVSNLVGNVVAHTPPGTPVRVGVGTVGDDAVLEVADRGPGLTAEQAAGAFERFSRVDGSRSRVGGGGAGLGLAIVDSIVAAHGGCVELDTAPGAGATVRVLLPAAPD